jgi:hypothetical protein
MPRTPKFIDDGAIFALGVALYSKALVSTRRPKVPEFKRCPLSFRISEQGMRLISISTWVAICMGILCLGVGSIAWADPGAEYQWSVPVPAVTSQGEVRAFLWIPPQCRRVQAVVVGQHNMLEEDILEHPDFRKAMSELGVAIVWITPALDGPFVPSRSGERFNKMMKDLGDVSGYSELEFAPIAPIGHSAAASYPWNFAAWAPQRTLGILSIHGDAPETPLAGFGHQEVHWPDGVIDGVPGVMVMGEYEWLDARLAPATVYRLANPKTPIAMLAEPGEGHFAACDDLVHFCAMFIRKCLQQRLAADPPQNQVPTLIPVDPTKGWLVQRWTLRQSRTVPAGPFDQYAGDQVDAFWAFDQEMAETIQDYHADMVGKLPQLLGFVQDGALAKFTPTHPMVSLEFEPEADGETFKLAARFLDTVASMGPGNDIPSRNNMIRWTNLPAGAAIGHPSGGGAIQIHRIEGPIEETGPNTFRLSFYRGASFDKPVAWLFAMHPGDEKYKSAVQQAVMNIPRNTQGAEQNITFDSIADQRVGTESVQLKATSSADLPVHFFVREGPAKVDGDSLRILSVPPRARFPVRITVVAWQWGRAINPKIQSANPVEQTFSLIP